MQRALLKKYLLLPSIIMVFLLFITYTKAANPIITSDGILLNRAEEFQGETTKSVLIGEPKQDLKNPSSSVKTGNGITRPEAFFAPDTNFFNSDGEKVYLDQYEGKTILLVFWATWCGACISEMPSLDALQKDFKQLPFEVIAVSEDFSGTDVVKDHFLEQEIRHLAIYHDYQNQLFRAMSVVGLPTAFLIDSAGRVKVVFKGAVKWHDEEIRAVLLSEIEGNPSTPKNSYKTSSLNKIVSPKKTNKEQTAPQTNNDMNEKNNEVKNEDVKTKK